MKRKLPCVFALTALVGTALYAQDSAIAIAGDWQGTLKTPRQGDLRIVVRIAKGDGGDWNARWFSIDQNPTGVPASSVTLKGSNLRLTIDANHGSYEGKVSADGASISGTWTQGRTLPLDLQRATKDTAWPTDPSQHAVRFITVDQDVKLEVLDWGGSSRA